jgi:L-iditol 2-dehydrogenase
MKTLVVEKDGSLSLKEVPIPRYTSKQALVRTISCGICNGTDAKLIHHTFKGYEDQDYPIMLGHEAVGEVIKVGSEVTSFQPGDKVLLPFVPPDPEFYGSLGSGWGGFSEYGVIDDPLAYDREVPECAFAQTVLPSFVNPVDAAMIVTLREVLSSIKRFGIKENQSIAVFGCGPVGLTFIRFLSLLGVSPIIAFDLTDSKLQDAREKGADYIFNSSKINVKEEIRKICPNGVHYVLDAVGLLSLINQAMEYIADSGKICCYGIAPTCEWNLDWSKAPYNWQLQFQQFPSKKEEGEATNQILSWIKTGVIDLKDYISDYFSFDQILDAFSMLEKRQISKKGIIVFNQEHPSHETSPYQ